MINPKEQGFTLKEFSTVDQMMIGYELLLTLYPKMTKAEYKAMLGEMVPHNYKQLVVFDGEAILGICGFWIGTKLWCGKYLELDNVIVKREYRSAGIGKKFTAYLEEKALNEKCNMLACDVYTDNFKAHKFYFNEGFIPRGFHFLKVLNPNLELVAKD